MDFWIQVLLDKYAHGMPLERQVKKMASEGLEVFFRRFDRRPSSISALSEAFV